jgi:methyl-accepting chemotaxis protein
VKGVNLAFGGMLDFFAKAFGSITIAVAEFTKHMAALPLIGDAFKGLSGPILQIGGDISDALFQAGQAATKFGQSVQTPQALLTIASTMQTVSQSVEQFSVQAKKSFDTVKQEVTRTTQSADALTQPLDDATTTSGDLVKVSGGVGIMFDKATGSITAMNRELFGALTLVRQINAEAVAPVQ